MTNGKQSSTNTRELILGILLEVNKEGQYSHIVIRNVLDKYQFLDNKDRSFIKIIAEGTLERQITIDYILNQFSKTPVRKMKPVIREILRMSVYQIQYMTQVPDSAVCNEAVKLAEKKGFHNLKGFVNGVLRNVARKKDEITFPNLSIAYSMPEWIVLKWKEQYGSESTKAMLCASLEKGACIIRCNHIRNTTEEMIASLKGEGVIVRQTSFFPDAFEIEGFDSLSLLKSFQEGRFAVQDLSSILVGAVAGAKPGQKVIDVCAAPGGKSLHVADTMGNRGQVIARDITQNKVDFIEENKHRLGASCVIPEVRDALIPSESDYESADLVIADLPCSGLGVLGRKNDLKLKASQEKVLELAKLQKEILKNVADFVKPGGTLIYSTCTVTQEENEDNRRFILENLPFEAVSIERDLPKVLQGRTGEDGYIQLLQGMDPCDGFFITKYRKK